MSDILIVDDEESICWGLEKLATAMGHTARSCYSAEDGIAAAKEQNPNLIVLDVRLPGMDGLTAMNNFQSVCPATPIVIMTAYGELDSAVAAIKNGAYEYLPKPFDLDRVRQVISRAIDAAKHTNKPGADNEAQPFTAPEKLGNIVGSCVRIQEVFRRIAFAATSNASVLITGESGTGKELAARAIHRYSDRAEQPFVAVNVAALSPTLAESELFGHVRGAFTGADRDRKGLLEQANGGVLFLDELAEIPLPIQVKLLRCLDQGEVLPIGANQPITTDLRIISATHQNLPDAVSNGKFRHDLFFRICGFQIELPRLKDRQDDIIQLSKHFIKDLKVDGSSPRLGKAIQQELRSRTWQGNVRELRNAIEHALILSRGGELLPEHLPDPIQQIQLPGSEPTELMPHINQLIRSWTEKQILHRKKRGDDIDCLYEDFLNLLEPEFLSTVMSCFDNQYVAASKALGIHRTTLKKKMTDHGMEKGTRDSI
ncbi:MAG: sigma-54 dependent transcriptional regulator [Pirellulaceae bacterium]|nr:sigma-54 dependent transcriptional regulator [Pirellulaceae bacterium]